MPQDNINVVVRIRGKLENEIAVWKPGDNSIFSDKETLLFDSIYDSNSQTSDIYEEKIRPVVLCAMNGFNGSVLAYGQTSSGKTYTMMGTNQVDGIIKLCLNDIFSTVENSPTCIFLIRMQYIEIYNEHIVDLFKEANIFPEYAKNENVSELIENDKKKYVELIVKDPAKCLEYLALAEEHRHFGSTNMNEKSSRSHTILRVLIENSDQSNDDTRDKCKSSWLDLVDLAGSERQSTAKTAGQSLTEAGFINCSLLTLCRVIRDLSKDNTKHISYRDSKLTLLLKESLGGNSKCIILCMVRPDIYSETKSTLQFALNAMNVKNTPIVNTLNSEKALLGKSQKEISLLQKELEQTKSRLKSVEAMHEVKESEVHELRRCLNEYENNIHKIQNQFCFSSQLNNHTDSIKNMAKRRMTWCPGKERNRPVYDFPNLTLIDEQLEASVFDKENIELNIGKNSRDSLKSVCSEFEIYQQENKALKADRIQLQKENKFLKDTIENLEKNKKMLRIHLKGESNSIFYDNKAFEEIDKKIEFEDERKAFIDTIKDLKLKIEELKNELSSNDEIANEKYKMFEKKIFYLNEEISSKVDINENLVMKITDLEKSNVHIGKLKNTIESLEEEISIFKQTEKNRLADLTFLNDQIFNLQNNLSEKEIELKRNLELIINYKLKEAEMDILIEENENLRQKINTLDCEINNLLFNESEQVLKMKNINLELESKIQELSDSSRILDKDLKDTKLMLTQYEENAKDVNQIQNLLKSEFDQKQIENKNLKDILHVKDNDITNLQENYEKVLYELTKSKNLLLEESEKCESLKIKTNDIMKLYDTLKIENDKCINSNSELQKKINDQEISINADIIKKINALEELNNQLDLIKIENLSLENSNSFLLEKYNSTDLKLTKILENNSMLNEKCQNLEKEKIYKSNECENLKTLKRDNDEHIKNFKSSIQNLEMEKNKLTNSLLVKNKEYDELIAVNGHLVEENKLIEIYKSEINDLKRQCENCEKEVNDYLKIIEDHQKALGDSQGEINDLETTIKGYKIDHAKLFDHYIRAKNQIGEMNIIYKEEKDKHEATVKKLEIELAKCKENEENKLSELSVERMNYEYVCERIVLVRAEYRKAIRNLQNEKKELQLKLSEEKHKLAVAAEAGSSGFKIRKENFVVVPDGATVSQNFLISFYKGKIEELEHEIGRIKDVTVDKCEVEMNLARLNKQHAELHLKLAEKDTKFYNGIKRDYLYDNKDVAEEVAKFVDGDFRIYDDERVIVDPYMRLFK